MRSILSNIILTHFTFNSTLMALDGEDLFTFTLDSFFLPCSASVKLPKTIFI